MHSSQTPPIFTKDIPEDRQTTLSSRRLHATNLSILDRESEFFLQGNGGKVLAGDIVINRRIDDGERDAAAARRGADGSGG